MVKRTVRFARLLPVIVSVLIFSACPSSIPVSDAVWDAHSVQDGSGDGVTEDIDAEDVGRVDTEEEDAEADTEEPEDTRDTEEPQDTKDTEEPQDTEDTEEPQDTKDTEEPQDTKDTEEPQDTEDTEEPQDTEDTEEPQDTEDTEEPQDTEDTEEPQDTEDTEEPQDTEDTEEPQDTEDTEEPQDTEDTEEPQDVPEDTKPDEVGEDTGQDTGQDVGVYEELYEIDSTTNTILVLNRFDAVVGSDGNVYFSAYSPTIAKIRVYRFDGSATDPQFEHLFDITQAILFSPRMALSDTSMVIVWDDPNQQEVFGLKAGLDGTNPLTDLLFSHTTKTVSHPDVALFRDAPNTPEMFWAVSQWSDYIGRLSFVDLPIADPGHQPDDPPGQDWDPSLSGGSEVHQGPSIAANRHATDNRERVAWVSYKNSQIFLHSCIRTNANMNCTVPFPLGTEEIYGFDASPTQTGPGCSGLGCPTWPHVAVDTELTIHIAWHNRNDTNKYYGVDYRRLALGTMTEPAETDYLPFALGAITDHIPPSLAVGDSLDVLVAFYSQKDASVYFITRRPDDTVWSAATPTEIGPARSTAGVNGNQGTHPVAVAYADYFWVLYNNNSDQLTAVKIVPK